MSCLFAGLWDEKVERTGGDVYKILQLTTEEIQERHMKFIAEISKHLATEPIQSEELNYEQKQVLKFRMARPFPKPYRPHKPIEIPYKWIEKEEDQA